MCEMCVAIPNCVYVVVNLSCLINYVDQPYHKVIIMCAGVCTCVHLPVCATPNVHKNRQVPRLCLFLSLHTKDEK